MLPRFELVWKPIWILAFGLPPWSTNEPDSATRETLYDCLSSVVLVPLVLP